MAGIADVDVFRAIVAGKKDQRVVRKAQLVERFEEAADLLVHIGHRAVKNLRGAFERKTLADWTQKIVGLHLLLGRIERGVGNQHPGIDVKWLVLVRGNEADRFFHNGGGGFRAKCQVRLIPGRAICVHGPCFVKPIGARRRGAFAVAEMPLPKVRRHIAGPLKQRRYVWHLRVQPVVHPARRVHGMRGVMAVDLVPRRVLPGHEGAAARRANGAIDIKLREERPLVGQSIQVRRLEL